MGPNDAMILWYTTLCMGCIAGSSYHPGSELLLGGLQAIGQEAAKTTEKEREKTQSAGARKSPAAAPVAKQGDAEGDALTPHSERC